MPDKRISELTHNTSLTLADNIPTESAGQTLRQTNADLANLYDLTYFKNHVTDVTISSLLNTSHGRWRVLNGGLLITGEPSLVYANTGAFRQILGGAVNTHKGSGNFWSVLAGNNQGVTGDYSVIVAGLNNRIKGQGAIIGGGTTNSIFADYSFIGGGESNEIYGSYNSICGGKLNIVGSQYSATLAGTANRVSGNSSAVVGGTLNIVEGATSFVGAGQGNAVYGQSSLIAAGLDNQIWGDTNSILGGTDNSISGSNSVVGGGQLNIILSQYATIVGGGGNTIRTDYSSILGGSNNYVSGRSSVVVGGFNNTVTGEWSFIGAGQRILLTGARNIIVGGFYNDTNASGAFLGGGQNNTIASNYSTIVGGRSNKIKSADSVVVGGYLNQAGYGEGQYCSILGGFTNLAIKSGSAVLGGYLNSALEDYSSVVGGYNNIATGRYSTILGGELNFASGLYNIVGGKRAESKYDGCLVLGDSRNVSKYAVTSNSATFHYGNGVYISGSTFTLQSKTGFPALKSDGQWKGNGVPGTIIPSGGFLALCTGIDPDNTTSSLWGVLNGDVNRNGTVLNPSSLLSTAYLPFSGSTDYYIPHPDLSLSKTWQYIPNQEWVLGAGNWYVTAIVTPYNKDWVGSTFSNYVSGALYLCSNLGLAVGQDGGSVSITGNFDFTDRRSDQVVLQSVVTGPKTLRLRALIQSDSSAAVGFSVAGSSFSYINVT